MKLIKFAVVSVALSLTLAPQQLRAATASEAEPENGSKAATPRTLIAQGEDLAKGGRWRRAQEIFLQVCSQDPANVVALHDLAISYAHTNELNEAAECERKALILNEQYVPAHVELAWILNKQNDKDGAREHLKKALDIEPENKTALQNLQSLMNRLRRQGNPAQPAQSDLAPVSDQPRVPVIETPVSKALVARGTSMYKQGKYDVSKRLFEQALENCPDSLVARSSLGVVRGTSGDIEGEIKEERLALALQPANTTVLCNLAWALAQKGELNDALSTYQKALSIDPALPEAQAGQGIVLFRSGKPEAGLAVLKEAVRLNPEQPRLRLALAALLQSADRTDEAIVEYLESNQLMPNNYEVKARLASAYLAATKFDKAAELYKQLVERSPSNVELRIGLGLALTKNSDISGAYTQFKKAIELDKNSAAGHACLSMIEELRGHLSQAESEARVAQEKDPNSKFFQESAERLAKSRKESDM